MKKNIVQLMITFLLISFSFHCGGGDASVTNNVVKGTPNLNIQNAVFPSNGIVSTAFNGSFDIFNHGSEISGSITWEVYLSSDNTLDLSDSLVSDGETIPLDKNNISSTLNFSGTWPANTGYVYLIIQIKDGSTVRTLSSAAILLSATPIVDYQISSISTSTQTYDTAITTTFSLKNVGTKNGAETINWSAYYSTDDSYDVGDTLLDSGSTTGFSVGNTVPVSITGTWTSPVGAAYIIVIITAGDDANGVNNTKSQSFTLRGVDYEIYSAETVLPTSQTAGKVVSPGYYFKIKNIGTNNGASTVNYEIFYNTVNSLDGNEVLFQSGTTPARNANVISLSINLTASWPNMKQTLYLIIRISASDDGKASNNIFVAPNTVNLVAQIHGLAVLPTSVKTSATNFALYIDDNTSIDSSSGESAFLIPFTPAVVTNSYPYELDISSQANGTYYVYAIFSVGGNLYQSYLGGVGNQPPASANIVINGGSIQSDFNFFGFMTGNSHAEIEPNHSIPDDTNHFGLHIHNGSSVTITGLADNPNDCFKFKAGNASSINFSLTWSSGSNSFDMAIYSGLTPILSATTTTADIETMNFTTFSLDADYNVCVNFGSGTFSAALPFSLSITGN